MTPKKPTFEQKIKHASPRAKDAFAYIDQGFAPGIGWDTILNGVLSVFGGNDEVIEASKAYMEAKYPEKGHRSQEYLLDFGDHDDDDLYCILCQCLDKFQVSLVLKLRSTFETILDRCHPSFRAVPAS